MLRTRSCRNRYGNDELIPFRNAVACLKIVRLDDLRRPRMQERGNRVERFARLHHMEAPAGSLVFRNLLDPLLESIPRTSWNV